MTSERTFVDYLNDILENIDKAKRFLKGVSKEELREDEEKLYAVIRALEVIGEAARRIPNRIRNDYPGIPWSKMTGMRNILIHEYFGVNFEVVWKTVNEELPSTRQAVAGLLKEIEGE